MSVGDLPCSLFTPTYFTPFLGEICVKRDGFSPWLILTHSSHMFCPLPASMGITGTLMMSWCHHCPGSAPSLHCRSGGRAPSNLLSWPWLPPSVSRTTFPKARAYFVSIWQCYLALNSWSLKIRCILCTKEALRFVCCWLLVCPGVGVMLCRSSWEQCINTHLQFIPYQSTLIYLGSQVSSAPFKCYIQI